jgi:hypothetical protein
LKVILDGGNGRSSGRVFYTGGEAYKFLEEMESHFRFTYTRESVTSVFFHEREAIIIGNTKAGMIYKSQALLNMGSGPRLQSFGSLIEPKCRIQPVALATVLSTHLKCLAIVSDSLPYRIMCSMRAFELSRPGHCLRSEERNFDVF